MTDVQEDRAPGSRDPVRLHDVERRSGLGARPPLVEVLGASRVIANLADAAVHTRAGVSVVAIIRSDEAIHAPGADTDFHAGDRVVSIGTAEGVAQLERCCVRPRLGDGRADHHPLR